MSEFTAAIAGMVVGFVLFIIGMMVHEGWNRRKNIRAARITDGVSASFIKELMRRAIQFHLECRSDGEPIRILQNDIDQAVDELLFAGGSLNRTLLGADGAVTTDE